MTDTTAADVVALVERMTALEVLRMSIYWACKAPTPSIRVTALGCSSGLAVRAPGLDRHPYPATALQHDTIMFRAGLRLNIIDPLTGQASAAYVAAAKMLHGEFHSGGSA